MPSSRTAWSSTRGPTWPSWAPTTPASRVGGAGRIEISRGIPLLEVPSARVDRSMGDVHPLGNPHFSLDPGLAPIITQNIVDGLARLAPENRPELAKNRQAFL